MSTPFNADLLPPLRDIIATNDLAAKKTLGQHFLLDINVTRKIVRAAGDLQGRTVIEIGPGPGGLTRAILESDAPLVVAIERDERCIAALSPLTALANGRLEIICGDALDFSIADIGLAPRAVIANLPYNIGTALLLDWLKAAEDVETLTLMFQLEVAERLVAKPGSAAYGRLSVLAQWRCEVELAFKLPARAFTPPPKVDSAVVHLRPYLAADLTVTQKALETVTAAAFGQRRKMLRSSLKPLGGESLCLAAGIAPTARAEELSIADFVNLAGRISQGKYAED